MNVHAVGDHRLHIEPFMFTKKDIKPQRYNNRFIIRNGDHIGIYKYIDGWLLLNKLLTKPPISLSDKVGYDLVYKVYDSYEDKINNTLLRYSINEPTNTIQDLVMVSEIYPLPKYVKVRQQSDIEAVKYAMYSDGDFTQTVLDILINKKIRI